MDSLSLILDRFSVSAGVFYTGGICGVSTFEDPNSREGHLHFLESGSLEVVDAKGRRIKMNEPSILFYPKPLQHRLIAKKTDSAKVVCATVRYGTGPINPLTDALPESITIRLCDSPLLKSNTIALFDEAFHQRSGRQIMLDRLTEIFLIQLLRYVMELGTLSFGVLAGLSHPQLVNAIVALHQNPRHAWTLDKMAALAHMSKSKFSEDFRQVVGQSPGEYLIGWRIALAQDLLKKNKSVAWVANEVGYESVSALARAFRKRTGQSPKQWVLKFS